MVASSPCKALLLALVIAGCEDRTAHSAPRPKPVVPSDLASATAAPAASAGEAPAPTEVGASQPREATPSLPLRIAVDGAERPAAQAQRFLHIGDSMVPLVGNYLRAAVASNEVTYDIVSRPSSSTLSWANDHGLREAMYRYDPQVVLISLGSNELFDPTPERRAQAIRQVVEEVRGRPCLWVGPPAWKQDRGFLRVLRDNVAPCIFFDSTALNLPRMRDGRHPSWTGGYHWALAVWKALGGTTAIPNGDVQSEP